MSLHSAKPLAVKLHNRFQIKCDGQQISVLGSSYDPKAASHVPLLEPARGKQGQILKRQPVIKSKAINWWKAQLIFRGLDFSSNDKKTLEAQMRAALNTEMTEEIRELEKKVVVEYQEEQRKADIEEEKERKRAYIEAEKERKRVFEARWPDLSFEGKAEADGRRMLLESFPSNEKQSKPIILKICQNDTYLKEIIEEMGLKKEFETFPVGHPDKTTIYNSISIIGRSESDFDKNDEWVAVKKSIQRAEAKLQREIKRQQQQLLDGTGKGKEWNVVGRYRIHCSEIEDRYDSRDLTLEIFAGRNQLWAKFNFGIIEGVMRFESQPEKTKKKSIEKKAPASSKPLGKGFSKRGREEFEDDEDENDNSDEDEEEEEEGEADFQLGAISLPSVKYSNWTYRWRGEETGEGEIQLGSDSNSYALQFCEPRGMKLEGIFGCEYFKDCTFTGDKITAGTGRMRDPSHEWSTRNWRAHEEARVGRWH